MDNCTEVKIATYTLLMLIISQKFELPRNNLKDIQNNILEAPHFLRSSSSI